MDTGVATLLRIGEVALQIKEAADTARQNKDDCDHVKSRVDTLHKTVLQYEKIVVVAKNEAVQSALEGAKTVLDEALRVVTDCQEERNIVCVIFTAGKLSKELSKVDGRITSVSTDVLTAVQAYLACRRVPERLLHYTPESLPQKITEVAGEIKEATEMVHRNKEDFMEIEKRASGVSTLMSLLENYMELVNQERMRAALEKLLDTFNQARTLVMSYRGIRVDVILWPNGKLAKQLRKVLDLMLSDINAVNLIVIPTFITQV